MFCVEAHELQAAGWVSGTSTVEEAKAYAAAHELLCLRFALQLISMHYAEAAMPSAVV
jgi:hypothetical protein